MISNEPMTSDSEPSDRPTFEKLNLAREICEQLLDLTKVAARTILNRVRVVEGEEVSAMPAMEEAARRPQADPSTDVCVKTENNSDERSWPLA